MEHEILAQGWIWRENLKALSNNATIPFWLRQPFKITGTRHCRTWTTQSWYLINNSPMNLEQNWQLLPQNSCKVCLVIYFDILLSSITMGGCKGNNTSLKVFWLNLCHFWLQFDQFLPLKWSEHPTHGWKLDFYVP